MIMPPAMLHPFTANIKTAATVTGLSESTLWQRIRNNELAVVRDHGKTLIVLDWPGAVAPPREGRAPSFAELVRERIVEPVQPRPMPEGKHRGRPRKHPVPADTGEAQLQP